MVHIGAVASELTLRTGDFIVADGGIENIGEGFGNFVKDGGIYAEILGENVPWGMGNPVIDHKGGSKRDVR